MGSILIVDDNKDLAELLGELLETNGYNVNIKHDGQEAIEHLKGGSLYDLVITDIIMPKSDGFDLIDFVDKHTNLKIIVMSGGGILMSPKSVIETLENRVDACLEKPVGMVDLLSTVEQVLGK